jgi:hypothetical protein
MSNGNDLQPSIAQLEERGTVMVTDLSRGRWFEPGSKDVFDNSPDEPDDYDRRAVSGVPCKCYNNTPGRMAQYV